MSLRSASLDALLRPRNVALVGATEKSFWSNAAFGNLDRFGALDRCFLVNRKGGRVYGRTAATSCVALDTAIDTALVMVPAASLDEVFEDLASASVRSVVLLSAGFAEMGENGTALQRRVLERANQAQMRLLGPNCLGYINYVDGMPVWATVRRRQSAPGRIAIISQSGAVAGYLADYAFRQSVPLTLLASTGNEADIQVADVVDWLVGEQETKAIAVFLESVRDPVRFIDAAWKAKEAGKPIVILKTGASELGARTARAHTGSLVGDDRVFEAACVRLGIVRVDSPEALITSADFLARVGKIDHWKGLAVAAVSGGICEMAADLAASIALPLADLAPSTASRLSALTEFSAGPGNPLDFTGAAMLDPAIFEKGLAALAGDPNVGLVTCLFDGPETEDSTGFLGAGMKAIGRGFAGAACRGLVISNTQTVVTPVGRAAEKEAGICYSGSGLRNGLEGIATIREWSRRHDDLALRAKPQVTLTDSRERPVGEQACLDYLERQGVPVVPRVKACSPEEALAAARELGPALAIKVDAPRLEHKSEAGGVALNVSPAQAADTFGRILESVGRAAPGIAVSGVVVSPMRGKGVELFVGTLRDATWGPAIAIGLGGVFVEALEDTALRLLPVVVDDVLAMLDELRGKKLLDGFRGAPAANRRRIAEVVVAIGDAAVSLGPSLLTLEVNPLWVGGDQVEAMDALTEWSPESAEHPLDD